MDKQLIFKYGQYLTHLVSCTINNKGPKAPFEGIDWTQLLKLAVFHNATTLVYPVISSFQIPSEIFSKWTYINKLMITREARQEIESQKIFDFFSRENIPFIKMKGIVTKYFYPAPFMRNQADIDICITDEHRKYCVSFMKEMGYELFSSTENTDEYMKDDFFYYELHSSVNPSTSEFYELFSEPFTKAKIASDGVGLVLTDEYFYLHLVTHLYKHFITEGCGIRLLCDLYIYAKSHPDLDYDFIRSILTQYGIIEFYDRIIELNKCLWEEKPFTEEQIEIATFIFKCGDHGSDTVRRLTNYTPDKASAFSEKSKRRVSLQIYFPGADTLKNRYPILEKAPVLLPFFWIKRGFSTLFFKRSALKEQKDFIKSFDSEEIRDAKKARELLGIKQK